jgi:nicotinate-nucleotide adenylyltransferase
MEQDIRMTASTQHPSEKTSPGESIGLLGGTFDPVHFGHLRIAEEVREHLSLSRIEFIPANIPPHKTSRPFTKVSQRLAMLRLALQGNPAFHLSEREACRTGVSYLVDTLAAIRTELPRTVSLFFLMGMDNFLEISTWHRYPELFSLSHFVVLSRPGYPRPDWREVVSPEVADSFKKTSTEPSTVEHTSGHKIFFHETTPLDISASDIRRRIGLRKSARYLLPEPVRNYILQNGLYLDKGEDQR